MYAADLTGDGWPDLLVTNDGAPNHLWVNQQDGTFRNEAMSRGIALTGNGLPFANMGIAVADCTSATSVVDVVSDVMSHTAATFCIHVPMFDTSDAAHSRR